MVLRQTGPGVEPMALVLCGSQLWVLWAIAKAGVPK